MQDHENPEGGAPKATPEIGSRPIQARKASWDPKGKRNLLIVGGVVGAALLSIVALSLSSGNKNRDPGKPSTATLQNGQPVPVGTFSESERQALIRQDDARIENARQQGTSAVAAPLPNSGLNIVQPPVQPPVQAVPAVVQQGPQRLDQNQAHVGAQDGAGDPGATRDGRLKSMAGQMDSMMTGWGVGGQQGQQGQRSATYVRRAGAAGQAQAQAAKNSAAAASGAATAHEGDAVVIPAYEQAYGAETLGPVDTDTPGKLRARILTGPLAGAIIVGTARRMGTQGVQLDFASAAYKGHSFKVGAYGVDIENAGDVVRGEYDGRYMQRYVFPVIAEGVRAYAGARAQTGTSIIALNFSGLAGQQTPPPTAEQARNAMYSAAAGQVAGALRSGPQDGHITLEVRTQFGIVFEQPVYTSDLGGQGTNSK